MRALIPMAALMLTGCTATSLSLHTVQISSESLPFPAHYQVEAARVAAARGGDPGLARVSYPRTTVGMTIASPQRWYVCVRGLPAAPKPDRLPNVMELAERLVDPITNAGVFDVILFFDSATSRPSQREGYDTPLCRDGQFERVTAEPPLT